MTLHICCSRSLVAVLLCAHAAHAGSIQGTVKFEGTPPEMKPLEMSADAVCHAMHKESPPKNEALVLGEGQTMGNVFVLVTRGQAAKEWPVPAEPFTLTQAGCVYAPHVFVVRAGQTLRVLNPDDTLHNVNGMPLKNTPFNKGMPKTLKELDLVFDKAEPMFPIKCDVHPWMRSYCAVVDHPFYAVTQADGKYAIDGLEAGEYEISVWHEKLGTQTFTVTVPADGAATQDVTFSRASRG